MPKKVSMDKSDTNKAAIDQIIEEKDISVIVRQVKYLNNMVEKDPRAVKRITKPMFGFKSFHATKNVLAGIEFMHMIRTKANSTSRVSQSSLLLNDFMRSQEKSV